VNGLSVKMEQGKPETVYWNPNTRLAATARVITRIIWGIDVLVSRRYRPAGAGGHARRHPLVSGRARRGRRPAGSLSKLTEPDCLEHDPEKLQTFRT
jgi:hypothetical protein